MPHKRAENFWVYAKCLYGRPGHRDMFLALQDRFGLDVNLLIFCVWAGINGFAPLTHQDVKAILAVLTPWCEAITSPLRTARRAVKTDASLAENVNASALGLLKDKILAAELASEQIAQGIILETGLKNEPVILDVLARKENARANLALYCEIARLADNGDVFNLVERLCQNAGPSEF